MNKRILLTGMALASSVAILASGVHARDNREDHEDNEQLVCYAWDMFPDERLKLNVKKHSRLSERKEERNFGHPRQTAFSVHGKHVIGDNMATVEGSVVTAAKTSTTAGPSGAHMGLHSKFVRGDGAVDFARPVTVECTTDEVSATPATWTCQSRNDFDVYHGFSKLTRSDETNDPACSIFEDGEFVDIQTTAEPIKGPASFSKQKPKR
jgi:hypothetical protein